MGAGGFVLPPPNMLPPRAKERRPRDSPGELLLLLRGPRLLLDAAGRPHEIHTGLSALQVGAGGAARMTPRPSQLVRRTWPPSCSR